VRVWGTEERKNLQFADKDSVAMDAYSREDHSSSSGSRCSTMKVLDLGGEDVILRWCCDGKDLEMESLLEPINFCVYSSRGEFCFGSGR